MPLEVKFGICCVSFRNSDLHGHSIILVSFLSLIPLKDSRVQIEIPLFCKKNKQDDCFIPGGFVCPFCSTGGEKNQSLDSMSFTETVVYPIGNGRSCSPQDRRSNDCRSASFKKKTLSMKGLLSKAVLIPICMAALNLMAVLAVRQEFFSYQRLLISLTADSFFLHT